MIEEIELRNLTKNGENRRKFLAFSFYIDYGQ